MARQTADCAQVSEDWSRFQMLDPFMRPRGHDAHWQHMKCLTHHCANYAFCHCKFHTQKKSLSADQFAVCRTSGICRSLEDERHHPQPKCSPQSSAKSMSESNPLHLHLLIILILILIIIIIIIIIMIIIIIIIKETKQICTIASPRPGQLCLDPSSICGSNLCCSALQFQPITKVWPLPQTRCRSSVFLGWSRSKPRFQVMSFHSLKTHCKTRIIPSCWKTCMPARVKQISLIFSRKELSLWQTNLHKNSLH